MRKKLIVMLLFFVMVIGLVPSSAVAVDTKISSNDLSQIATNLNEEFISDVEMTIPSDAFHRSMDIVFVIDGSTSSDASTLAIQATELLDDLNAIDVLDVHVGLVIFGGSTPILFQSSSLIDTDDETAFQEIKNTLIDKKYDGESGRSGSNLQAGVEVARTLLKSGTSSEKDKYMIMLTDGGARMWVNDDGEALAQMPYLNNWNTTEDFIARYINGSLELRTFDVIMQDATAGKEIGKFAITESETDDNKNVVSNLQPGMQVATDMDYYSNLEAATYFAAKSMIECKNNQEANIIWVDYPYNKGTKYGDYTESFKSWMADNGYVERYDSDTIIDPFEVVKDSLTYYVDKGSSIINTVGYGQDNYGNSYDFKMVNLDSLILTVGNQDLQIQKISDDHYGFGTNKNGVYEFELLYYADGKDGNSDECFELLINTAVTLENPVKLKYQVKLTNPQVVSAQYGVYDEDGSENLDSLRVSKETTLYPVDSEGNHGTALQFPLPTVSYTVDTTTQDKINLNIVPMTVYIGGSGYEGTVSDNKGNIVGVSENTLPEPGYTIELPEDIDQHLKKYLGVSLDSAVDLSNYLTFTYNDGIETRVWHVERYDQNEGNSSQVEGRYLYRLVPDANQPSVRLQFTDSNGNIVTSDDFYIDQNHPNQTYTMSIYAGSLNQHFVKAEVKLPNSEDSYDYEINVTSAELKIRGVVLDEENNTTDIITDNGASDPVKNVTAQVPEGTEYYYKTTDNQNSAIQVANADKVKLLVDDVLPSAKGELEKVAFDTFDELPNEYNIIMNYLDLVYTSNSNAVVGANNPITLYWPYPEGTDKNTEFFIVHYNGLDRNEEVALEDNYTMDLYSSSSQNGAFKLQNTDIGIKITVDSFSPFALIWEKENDNVAGNNVDTPNIIPTGDNSEAGFWGVSAICSLAVLYAVIKKRLNLLGNK